MATNRLLDAIKERKYFYRDNYRRACGALAVVLVVILLLNVAIMYVYLAQPTPDFYATSSNGALMPVAPLNAPNYSNTPLIQ